MVPVKGGIGGIVRPPIGRCFTTYIPLNAFWGVICHRSHLLREPETTIDIRELFATWLSLKKAGYENAEVGGSSFDGEKNIWLFFGSRKRWDRWHSPSPNWQVFYHLYTT